MLVHCKQTQVHMQRGSTIENDTVFGVICQLPLLREEFRIAKLTFHSETCGTGRLHVGLCPALLVFLYFGVTIPDYQLPYTRLESHKIALKTSIYRFRPGLRPIISRWGSLRRSPRPSSWLGDRINFYHYLHRHSRPIFRLPEKETIFWIAVSFHRSF